MPQIWNDSLAVLGGVASLLIILDFLGAREWLQRMKPWSRIRVLLLLLSLVAFSVGMYGRYSSSVVTEENIENHVTRWLKKFRLTSQPVYDPDKLYFGIKVTFDDGLPVLIARSKEFDRYLTLEADIILSSRHKEIFERLSVDEKSKFQESLTLEVIKARVHADIRPPGGSIRIVRNIPITKDLTEYSLIEQLNEFYFDEKFVVNWIAATLEHGSPIHD